MHATRFPSVAPFLLLLIVAAVPTAAHASGMDVDLRMSMAGGGDTVAEVSYSDGSEDALKLGTWFSLTGGPTFGLAEAGPHALQLATLVGFGGWSTGPENTDDRIGLTRFPVEVLAFYELTPSETPLGLRLGGGLAYHLIGGASGSGSLEGLEIDIDNALGWVGEVSLTWDVFYFGLRYTGMTYRVEGLDMDASSVGGMIGVLIPTR